MSDDVRLMYDSKYIGAWDLLGNDVTVTIAKVSGGVVEGENGRKDRAPLLHFKGWPKPMVCNKTNMRTIAAMYGTFAAESWLGKRVTLYATKCKAKGGGDVDCVRIRPKVPTQPGVPQSAVGAVPVDQEMRKNQVEQSCGREPGEG